MGEVARRLGKPLSLIRIWRWAQVEASPVYAAQRSVLQRWAATDDLFRARLDKVVTGFSKHFSLRRPLAEGRPHFLQYIMGELPVLLSGLHTPSAHYRQLLYPSTWEHQRTSHKPDSLYRFLCWVRNHDRFARLRQQLGERTG